MKRWLSWLAVALRAELCLGIVAILVVACGGDKQVAATGDLAGEEIAGASSAAGTVDAARIDDCGGFTVDDAAELLGVPPETVTLSLPEYLNYELLKTCAFEDEATGRGVSFSLSWTETPEEMIEDLQEERQNVGLAQSSIDTVTGSASEEAASYEIAGIGDEAFYAAVNGTVVARVANVRVQVMNAPDLETRKAVAARVASRLR